MYKAPGRLLIITEKCAVVSNDDGNGFFIGSGHHTGDDMALLFPGDVCFVIRKETAIVKGTGLYAKGKIVERDIPFPVDHQWHACGQECEYCYLIFAKGFQVRILEVYIENATMGIEPMACMRFLD